MADLVYDNLKQLVLPSLWESLSYPELINFCSTSKEYLAILDDPLTWITLFERDYNLVCEFPEELNLQDYYELHYLLGLPKYEDEQDELSFDSYYGKMRNFVICGIAKGTAEVDKYLLSKLTSLISMQNEHPTKYAVFDEYGSILAKIKGKNIYEMIFKLLSHFKFAHHTTIQSLLHAVYFNDIKNFQITSFPALIDNLIEMLHDRVDEEFFIIQPLNGIKTL